MIKFISYVKKAPQPYILSAFILNLRNRKEDYYYMEEKNLKSTKGPAYSQPEHIKKKSKWTKKTTIWCIVILVIVLGILAIIGAENGWFKTQDMINGKLVLGDYSTIEIDESDVKVDEATIDSYVNYMISQETTHEEVTEGTVEDGDTISLDYTGVLVGEEEPFDGGTASGTSLTIGSGTMIEGFEDQIIGHEIGETFDINVTFPEEYAENLAGKDAVFTITVNSKTQSDVPELTDELVQHYSAENMDVQLDSVEAFKDYYRERLSEDYLESAILDKLVENSEVKYYNEANLASLTQYNESSLAYYGSQFGVDSATMASMYGYDSPKAYAEATTKDTLHEFMILEQIAEDQGITYSDEELNEVLQRYMEREGFTGTLDEFKAQASSGVTYLITESEVLMPKVMEYLKGNVVIVESPEEDTEPSSEAEEDASEAETEEASETEAAVTAEAETEETSETEENVTTGAESEQASEAVTEEDAE